MGSNACMQAFHSVPETTACVSQSGSDTKDGKKKKKGRRRDQCPEYGEQQNAPGSQAWWCSPIIPALGRLWLRTGKPPCTGHILEKRQRLVTLEKSRNKSPEMGEDWLVTNQEDCQVAQGYVTHLACTRPWVQISTPNTKII